MTKWDLYYKSEGLSAYHIASDEANFSSGHDQAKKMIAAADEKPTNGAIITLLAFEEGDDHPTVWNFKWAVPEAPAATLLPEYEF